MQLWLQGLPPETKRRVRADLKALASGATKDLDIKALRRELDGFLRLRVGDYRIVYHLPPATNRSAENWGCGFRNSPMAGTDRVPPTR